MPAQREPSIIRLARVQPRIAVLGEQPSAVVLPLRRTAAIAPIDLDEASESHLAPARGLMIGLAAGALLWAGIFALAWAFFH